MQAILECRPMGGESWVGLKTIDEQGTGSILRTDVVAALCTKKEETFCHREEGQEAEP